MTQTVPLYVLDACALIAYLNDEEGGERVEQRLLEAAEARVTMFVTAVNVCEVYYDCLRTRGAEEAKRLMEQVQGLPVEIVRTIDDALLREAGRMKVEERISLADAFALAIARLKNAKVLSSDHHEFDRIEEKGEIQFEWIR